MEEKSKPGAPAGGGWGGPQPVLTLPGGRTLNPWMTLTALMFGFFMSLLDATIVNIAITDIQRSFNTDLTSVSWVLNSYSLAFAVLLVTMGRLADQFGRKRLFMIGMVIFSIGSLLCAIAPTIELLIIFRIIQGVGAAALNPVSLAIITVVFPPAKRGAAIGAWGAAAGLAAALGPVLGGFLVQNFDWRWIFLVNLPFCIIGLFMVYFFVPESRDANASKTLDIPGFLTLSIGMFCLVFAIIEGNDWGWSSGGIIALFAGSIVAMIAFYFVETRQAQPILDFKLFRIRSFTAANIVMFMFSVAMQGAFLILVIYLISVQGYKELDAAYALIPIPLASFFVSAASARLGSRFEPRILGGIGMALIALGYFCFFTLNLEAGYIDVAWRGIVIGLGMGFCFTTFPTLAISEIPRPKLGVASGTFNTFRQLGFAIGVAVLLSLYTGQVKDQTTVARADAIEVVKSSAALPQPVKDGFITSLQNPSNQQGRTTSAASFIPAGQPANSPIALVGKQVETRFKQALLNAFTTTWFAAAMIALFGLVPLFFVHKSLTVATGHGQIAEAPEKAVVEMA